MDRQIERRPPAEPGEIVIHLDGAALGQEGVVGEIGAEQDQQVGLMGRVVAGAVAQQPAHPDVVGVVVLDPFLAPQRVPDRARHLVGERHHRVVGAPDPRAAEQGHGAGGVEAVGQRAHLVGGRHEGPSRGHGRALAGRMLRVPVKDVTRHDEHGDAPAPDGVLDRDPREPRHLGGLAHELAVVAALDEQPLGVRLLEEGGTDLLGRDVRGDGEYRHAAPVRVVQSLD